jgi:hypothetical protein
MKLVTFRICAKDFLSSSMLHKYNKTSEKISNKFIYLDLNGTSIYLKTFKINPQKICKWQVQDSVPTSWT